MIKFFQKRTVFASTLLGLVFFFGGTSTIIAQEDQANATAGSQEQSDAIYSQLNCNITNGAFGTKGTLADCFPVIIYYVIYKPAALFLAGTGYIFDAILGLSITGDKVSPPFVSAAWTVVRDFSNMLFIFILLYTGIMTMFGAADWRKVVLQVVIVALLINFSLFFTKVVIDAGNVLAVGIRSSISPGQSISEGLASAFQPQNFLLLVEGDKIGAGTSVTIFFVAAVVSGFAGYYFFKAALLFAGRLIAFWFLMIVSPFAFISTALPKGNVFSKWLDTLLSQAFVAPVFLFFIYLIMQVISAGNGILEGFARNGDWFDALIGPVIVATLLVLALKKALKFAEGMAGEFGAAGSSFVSGMMGVAGVATGGVAGLARQTVGRYAARKLAGGTLEEGSAAEKAAQWATRTSFDVRNIGDKNSLLGKTLSGKVFAKEQGIGGREKIEKDRITRELKAAESGKLGVFEEQGVRSRQGEVTANNLAKAKAELATIEKSLASAQKAHDESPERKERDAAKAAYDRVVDNRSKGGSEGAVTAAKEALEKAESTHSSSPSSIALNSTLSKLKAAKKAEEEAVAFASKTATEQATLAIGTENKRRMEASAKKAETKKRYNTAAEIRNKMKGKNVEDTLKDLLKKEKEEGSVEKPKTETEGGAKH